MGTSERFKMMHRTMVVAVIAAVLVSAVSAGGVNVSSLSINPGHNKAAKLTLGNADEGFMVKMDPGATGSFQIVHRDNPIFSIDSAGAVMVNGVLNSKGAFKTEGSVSFMGTPQWQLAKIENFEEGAKGWSNQSTTHAAARCSWVAARSSWEVRRPRRTRGFPSTLRCASRATT